MLSCLLFKQRGQCRSYEDISILVKADFIILGLQGGKGIALRQGRPFLVESSVLVLRILLLPETRASPSNRPKPSWPPIAAVCRWETFFAAPLARRGSPLPSVFEKPSLLFLSLAFSSEDLPIEWDETWKLGCHGDFCRYRSIPLAASRPSRIAQTISDAPRFMSPAAKTPSTLVR